MSVITSKLLLGPGGKTKMTERSDFIFHFKVHLVSFHIFIIISLLVMNVNYKHVYSCLLLTLLMGMMS